MEDDDDEEVAEGAEWASRWSCARARACSRVEMPCGSGMSRRRSGGAAGVGRSEGSESSREEASAGTGCGWGWDCVGD
jgi:hypothetical protein